MNYNFIFSLTTVYIIVQLTECIFFQACCGNGICRTFDSPEAMYGLICCGDDIMNSVSHICCDGVVRERNVGAVYVERCCGNQTITNIQTCCNNNVFNIANGLCCGDKAFIYSPTTHCCENTLYENTNTTSACCGSSIYDGGKSQICCGKKIYNLTEYDSCCKNNATIPLYNPYNSKTQQCCSTPILIASTSKCCYLKTNSTYIPTIYNSTTQCCKYPYTKIGTIVNDTCLNI
uniref:Galaxin-like n=1 Tax=Strongyloides papillosus TaxID=174720 RepID=A0A0N5BA15_STREA